MFKLYDKNEIVSQLMLWSWIAAVPMRKARTKNGDEDDVTKKENGPGGQKWEAEIF